MFARALSLLAAVLGAPTRVPEGRELHEAPGLGFVPELLALWALEHKGKLPDFDFITKQQRAHPDRRRADRRKALKRLREVEKRYQARLDKLTREAAERRAAASAARDQEIARLTRRVQDVQTAQRVIDETPSEARFVMANTPPEALEAFIDQADVPPPL